ncbi:MAG: hypothetical protein ACRD0P_16760 [Stackebrandtia sp.]
MTEHAWSPYDQGWYDALLDAAAMIHPFITARGLARKLAEPPDDAALEVPGYREGYYDARLTIRCRIAAGTTIWRLSGVLLVSIRTMRCRRDNAVANLITEAEQATSMAARNRRERGEPPW